MKRSIKATALLSAILSHKGAFGRELSMAMLSKGLTWATPNALGLPQYQTLTIIEPNADIRPAVGQRHVVTAQKNRLKKQWNPLLVNPLSLGIDPNDPGGRGVYRIMDAQHQRLARAELDATEGVVTPMLAIVTPDCGPTVQSTMFVGKNTNKPVKGNQRFYANILAGHNPEVEIERLVQRHGFEIDFLDPGTEDNDNDGQDNGIRNAATLLNAHKTAHFDDALRLLKAVWGRRNGLVPAAYRKGEYVCGLCYFLKSQAYHRPEAALPGIISYMKGRKRMLDLDELWDRYNVDAEGYSTSRPKRLAFAIAETLGLPTDQPKHRLAVAQRRMRNAA